MNSVDEIRGAARRTGPPEADLPEEGIEEKRVPSREKLRDAGVTDDVAGMLRTSLRFGWALSLLGMQESVRLVGTLAGRRRSPEEDRREENRREERGAETGSSPDVELAAADGHVTPREETSDPGRAFDEMAECAEHHLSPDAKEIYRALDRWQRDAVDFLWNGVPLPLREGGKPLGRVLLAGGMAGIPRRSLASLAPFTGGFEPELRRLADLLEAFELFADGGPVTQEALPREARQLLSDEPPFEALWRLEGLGWSFAEAARRNAGDGSGEAEGEGPRAERERSEEDCSVPRLPAVEPAARMPLLTGLGLSLAKHLIRPLSTAPDALLRLDALSRRAAPEGNSFMVFEASGFIARQLAPNRHDELAASAAELSRRHQAAFWHGSGRALYFAPALLRPGGADRALEIASTLEAPLSRGNALGGAMWAATLVHLRHPHVLDQVLDSPALRTGLEHEDPSILHGMTGALTTWMHFVGDWRADPLIWTLADHYGQAAVWPWLERALASAERQSEAVRLGELSWDDVYLWLPAEDR